MLSQLQKRKLKKLFDLYDVNNSGFITEADYEKMAQSQAEVMGYQPNSLEYNILRSQFRTLWKDLQKEIDTNNDGQIALDEFLEYKDKQLNTKGGYRPLWLEQSGAETAQSYEKSAEDAILKLTNLIFERLDSNGDEKISREEYKKGFVALQNESLSEEIFDKLDINKNGELSKEEVLQNVRDFFYSEDPDAPGNWLLGSY